MAVLSDSERAAVWAQVMENLSNRREGLGLSKSDLRAAVDAADSWVDTNSSDYNLALPVAARTTLTAAQKAELLLYVVSKRWLVGA